MIKCLVNGKSYVGESLDIKTRMDRHTRGKKQVIHQAITKYGVENFEVYVEYFPNFDKSTLMILEEELIKKSDSVSPNGYNISTKGYGRAGAVLSDETKEKISNSLKGRTLTTDHKQKVSNSLIGNKRSVGKITPDDVKEKLKASSRAYYDNRTPEKDLKIQQRVAKAWETRRLNKSLNQHLPGY
jgi:group I intron endonuclease